MIIFINFEKIFSKTNYRNYLKIIIYYYLYFQNKIVKREIDFD